MKVTGYILPYLLIFCITSASWVATSATSYAAAKTTTTTSKQAADPYADSNYGDDIDDNELTIYDDKWEAYNHPVFTFNDTVDKYFLKPIAQGYDYILPGIVKKGIGNFFSNMGQVPTFINDVLQLNFYRTNVDAWRFLINTTIGIGGIFDVASKIGLQKRPQDLGLTFAKWGYKESRYFIIPLLGPSTVRDAIALPVDFFYFTLWPDYIRPVRLRNVLLALNIVSDRADLLDADKLLDAAALDKYGFIRDAYLQNRNYQIRLNDMPWLEAEQYQTESGADLRRKPGRRESPEIETLEEE